MFAIKAWEPGGQMDFDGKATEEDHGIGTAAAKGASHCAAKHCHCEVRATWWRFGLATVAIHPMTKDMTMIRADNRDAALKLVLGLADGVDAASVTPDFTWWSLGQGERTPAEFNESLAAWASMRVGPPRFGVRGVTSQGDRVAIELEGLFPLTGGRIYNNCYHFLVAFQDGVPRSVREYSNTAYTADTFAAEGAVVAINQPHNDLDGEADDGGATPEERKAITIRMLNSTVSGGLATELLTSDFRWWVPGRGSMSLAAIQSVVGKFQKMWGGPGQVDVIGATLEGTRVALETESRIPLADGRTYHNSYHLLAKFRGDKIRELREYYDSKYFRELFAGAKESNLYN